uniref:Reverse transcriptase zinc-binding domain-containing protein n=1 Tax=Cannabis sativa TaxID=3483 RepID=A0A803QSE6_CANSA
MMAKFWWKSQSSARSKGVTWTGVRRSIGRGHDVSILQDTWLPDLDNPYVTSVNPGLVNQRVSSLFLVGDLAWDFELVEDMFEARDRNLIVSIQLSATAVKDDWYWCREPSWFYTVKSAYKLLQEMSSASVNVENQARWKLLWQLDVPPKVHHFIWRAILGCLPTKSQLNTKHVNVDLMCPFGNFTSESIHHVLLQCGFAQSCWRVSGVNMAAGLGVDFSSWFFNVAETQSRVLACEAAIVGWKIWPARNDVLWNNKSCSAMEVVRSARVVLDQWKNAQSQKCGALLVNNINNVFERWRKPVFNTVKVNVDGAIFEAENKFGVGCVARDSNGCLIVALSVSRFGLVKAEIAKIIGIKEALSLIKKKQWTNVVIKIDALVVVQAINSAILMPCEFGLLARDCRVMFSSLSNVSLIFVKRSAKRPLIVLLEGLVNCQIVSLVSMMLLAL